MRIIVLLLIATGCAQDYRVRYPGDDPAPGSLTFAFTSPAADVSLAVNGTLLVDDVHTGRIHVDNMPSGSNDVIVAVGADEKAMKIWIDAGKETTVPLGSSGVSSIDGWRASFVSLAGVVLYALLR